ncbi:MAG: hypothetical protein HXY50_13160 [Ignavibacteriaceae bacterium]|nr:hypothetical protein [Ignavibacteriaceae bacterium]
MSNSFQDSFFNLVTTSSKTRNSNVIKSHNVVMQGVSQISFEEDTSEGIKVVLHKDGDGNLKEIRFICSCGQTKSLVLDYSE